LNGPDHFDFNLPAKFFYRELYITTKSPTLNSRLVSI
jgi:hypothetical protein